jgi:hypothetical protein
MNISGWEGLSMSTRWLGMLLGLPHFEVAGWGGIYSHQPKSSRWWSLLAKGAPDSPVRCHVILPLGLGAGRSLEALSSSGTGQSGAPLTAALTSAAVLFTLQSRLLRADIRCSAGAPDSPVAHRTVRWIIAELRLGNPKVKSLSWSTLLHRTLSGGTPDSPVRQTRVPSVIPCSLCLNPFLGPFIGLVWTFGTCITYRLEQTS